MDLKSYAKRELQRMLDRCEDEEEREIQQLVTDDILEIVEVFNKQRHSDFSADHVISIIKRLLAYKPLSALTGEDDEWTEMERNMEQNTRCSSVFRKNKDNKTAYNIEGRQFSVDGGKKWHTNKKDVISVKFPYAVPEHPATDRTGKVIGDICIDCFKKLNETL